MLHNAVLFHADDRVVRAGHAHVRDIGRAPGKDAFISGGDVGMSAYDGGNLAVEVPTHRDFFRSGFSVHVHDYDLRIAGNAGELGRGRAEGVVDRRHVRAALKIQDGASDAALGVPDVEAPAGRAIREIRGTQQARLAGEILDNFLALPDVIPTAENVGARFEKLFGNSRRDAESRSSVFTIDDAEI